MQSQRVQSAFFRHYVPAAAERTIKSHSISSCVNWECCARRAWIIIHSRLRDRPDPDRDWETQRGHLFFDELICESSEKNTHAGVALQRRWKWMHRKNHIEPFASSNYLLHRKILFIVILYESHTICLLAIYKVVTVLQKLSALKFTSASLFIQHSPYFFS